MTNTLILGGTSYIGKRIVERLLEEGCSVTVATRGRTPDAFGDRVKRVHIDREHPESIKTALAGATFDIVYDQIGFAPDDIAGAIEVFAGKAGHYVFTSTISVYDPGSCLSEADFDPMSIDPGAGGRSDFTYKEGKRRAEAMLFQRAPFDSAAVRLSIVTGPDDNSGRLQFHVDRLLKGLPIVVPHPRGRYSHVEVDDAGRFIAGIGLRRLTGPYNAAADPAYDAAVVTEKIGRVLGIEPKILESGDDGDRSPYAYDHDLIEDTSKARRDGFVFRNFDEWLPEVVRGCADRASGS